MAQRLILTMGAIAALCCSTDLALAQGQTLELAPVQRPHAAKPSAELKIFSSKQVSGVWKGSGPSTLDSDLCVASTTGRFRLEIVSPNGVLLGPSKLRYTLRFRDATGFEQLRHVEGVLTTFEGSSPEQSDCTKGPNSTLVVESSEQELLSQQAGSYNDRLILAVTPL